MSAADLTRLLVAGGLSLVGVLLLAYCAWARRGGSPGARGWIEGALGADSLDERMTVLGAPMIAVLCLCCAALVAPVAGGILALVAVPLGILALALFLWAMIRFIPLPDALYPRWARPVRARRRAEEQALRAALRRRGYEDSGYER